MKPKFRSEGLKVLEVRGSALHQPDGAQEDGFNRRHSASAGFRDVNSHHSHGFDPLRPWLAQVKFCICNRKKVAPGFFLCYPFFRYALEEFCFERSTNTEEKNS